MANTRKTTKTIENEAVIPDLNIENISEEKPTDDVDNLLDSLNANLKTVTKNKVSSIQRDTIEKISNNELLPVRSVTRGGLVYKSRKTGNLYTWDTFGQVLSMTWEEILNMNNTDSVFVKKPYLVIEDGRAVKFLRLVPLYQEVDSIIGKDLTAALNNRDNMKKLCERAMETNMGSLLADRLSTLNQDGIFDSNSAITAAEKVLGVQIVVPESEDE